MSGGRRRDADGRSEGGHGGRGLLSSRLGSGGRLLGGCIGGLLGGLSRGGGSVADSLAKCLDGREDLIYKTIHVSMLSHQGYGMEHLLSAVSAPHSETTQPVAVLWMSENLGQTQA